MKQNSNSDEIFEIRPDTDSSVEEDLDMKVAGMENIPEPETTEVSAGAEAAGQEIAGGDIEAFEPAEQNAAVQPLVDGELTGQMPAGMETAEPATLEQEFAEDDFSVELEEMEQEEQDSKMVEEIGDSIIQQVNADIETSFIAIESAGQQDYPETLPHPQLMDEDDGDDERPLGFFARIPWWGYTVAGVVLVILATAVWIGFTKSGRGTFVKMGSKYAAEQVTYQPVAPIDTVDVPDETDDDGSEWQHMDIEVISDDHSVVTPELSPTPVPEAENEPSPTPIVEKMVYNVLIIGEESINTGGYRGRSDLIMIASINKAQGSVKLTSIMRDCLVSIPGYSDNRINAAYAIGGVSMLYDTLKMNLGIDIDNYVLVNFDGFEAIIDAIGGVDVELTTAEAKYLNTTNYISNPVYRNVVAGMNHFNGNQALGYCRVRNVATPDNEYSDFGRTSRQRRVISALYKSVSEMNYFGLVGIAGKCLPYVTTDLSAEEIENYINMILDIGISNGIENFRIPIKGSYSDAMIRDMLVTKIDLDVNSLALLKFIYGEESTAPENGQ